MYNAVHIFHPFQFVYTVNSGAALSINNGEYQVSDHVADDVETSEMRNGHIVLGLIFTNELGVAQNYGKMTIDYLTIWDEPLTEADLDML